MDPEPERASALPSEPAPLKLGANWEAPPPSPASACLTNMLIRVQIFTHLISRSRGCFSLIGGGEGSVFNGGFKYGLKVMRRYC